MKKAHHLTPAQKYAILNADPEDGWLEDCRTDTERCLMSHGIARALYTKSGFYRGTKLTEVGWQLREELFGSVPEKDCCS